ncbi:MAG TPA: carboxypeptidase regulatory-like domain-containing protein [bacterium]|nr:carboxypeptidase regulatory-like domain-containing protein [bacterium]
MVRKLLRIVFLILILKGIILFSDDYEIKGRVVDRNGSGIKNALVAYGPGVFWINYKSVRTDENGFFHLKNLPHEKSIVAVQCKGFSPKFFEITPGKEESIPFLNVELEPGHSVSGYIIDENGKPVKGAQISTMALCRFISAGCEQIYRYLESSCITDEKGYFKLEDLPSEGVFISVYAEGYAMIDKKFLGVDRDDYKIVLKVLGCIRGKIIDEKTKNPVKKFKVKLNFPVLKKITDLTGGFSCDFIKGVNFESEDGTFEISNLTPDAVYKVIIESEGFAPFYIEKVKAKRVQEKEYEIFELKPSFLRIEGYVYNSVKKTPVSDAEVIMIDTLGRNIGFFSWINDYYDYEELGVVRKTRTDEKGKFTISDIRNTRGYFIIKHPEYGKAFYPEIPITEKTKTIEFPIDPSGKIEGIVYDKNKSPISGVEIYLEQKIDGDSAFFGYVKTDENGFYSFQNLSSGYYTIRVSSLNGVNYKEVYLNPGENKKVDFGLEKGAKIKGRVIHRGKPLEEVEVSIIDIKKRTSIAKSTTDKNGEYEIIGLEKGEYKIEVMKGDWLDPNKLLIEKDIKIKNEENEINFVFPESTIEGKVIDFKTKKPVSDIIISAYKKIRSYRLWGKNGFDTYEYEWIWQPKQKAKTDKNGNFKLENVEDGMYVIVAGDINSKDRVASKLLRVKNPLSLKNIILEINQPGKLKVELFDKETGKIIEKASVCLFTSENFYLHLGYPEVKYDDYSWFSMKNPYSFKNGEIIFENLKPGIYYVFASAPGYVCSRKEKVVVKENGISEKNIKLGPGCMVEFILKEPEPPFNGILTIGLKLKTEDGRIPLIDYYGYRMSGIYEFFDEKDGKKVFVINTLKEGRYTGEIEIYRENSLYVATYKFQKPLYRQKIEFSVEKGKKKVIEIDMREKRL